MVLQGTELYYNALFAGSLGFITFGWDAGVLGGVLLTPEFMSAVGNPTDTYKISMITSTFLLASWFGCMLITFLGIHLGRKNWILLGNAVELVGTIISASSYSYGQLIAGRVFIGIGNGFLTSMIPVYMAEIATEKNLRGRGVNAMIAAASLGTALAYWVDFGMVFAHGTQAVWRFPVAFQAFWGISTMVAFMRLPETPRYYYAKGLVEKADYTLEQVYGMDLTEGRVQQAKAEILAALELEHAAAPSLKVMDFFWDSSSMQVARRIRTGVLLIGIAYLMGIDMIFYYMTTIFQVYIRLEPLTSSGLAGTATTVLAITNYLGVYYMEKFGRRTWLITGAVVQTIFMAAFTGLLSSPGTKTGAAAAAMLFVWIAVFGPTWGPVTYVYASEIMPLRYRHIGFALSVSSQWLMAFTTVFAGPIAIADNSVGWKTWIWFLVFNFIAIPYVYFCCPETRGRTLEEIDLIFITGTLKDTTAAKTLEHEGHESELTSEVDSVNEKTIQTQEQGVDVAKSADMEAPKEAPEPSS